MLDMMECGFGTQTAGAVAGGYGTGSAIANATEEYNGTSWTTCNTRPLECRILQRVGGSVGTQTDALHFWRFIRIHQKQNQL